MTWLLVIAVMLLLVYEIRAAWLNEDLTISELIWKASTRHPFVPFMAGVLAGHLFA